MEPPLLLLLGAEVGEDLGVSGIRRLVAEDDRAPDRRPLDLVHQPELHLTVALAAQLGWKMRRTELLPFDLLLQGPNRAHEASIVGLQHFEGIHLVAHEPPHPFELLLKLGLGREVPGHRSVMPSSIMPTMVPVSPSYIGSGRRPLRWSIRL